jgi:hypothetical protein
MDSSLSPLSQCPRQFCSLDTRAILESVKFGRQSQILASNNDSKVLCTCPKQSQQVLDGPHVIIHGRRRIGFGCRAVRREVCRCIQHAASPRASRLPHPAALAARVDVVLCTYNARPSSATVKSASSLPKKGQNLSLYLFCDDANECRKGQYSILT